ncbi:MAG: hypothetical protein HOW73_13555 [Polyangiaceae bacterium]|nr:hypothetical protein [Polyangiaceae bacterium]
MTGAQAIGLCKAWANGEWGVRSASWIRSDGTPLNGALLDGKGILKDFGPNTPREGNSFLVLSSGAARDPADPGFQDPGGYWKEDLPHGAPPGYPKESPACPDLITGEPYDSAGLRLVIQTPTDAKGFSFEFNFYTYEYPDYICSEFNDFFVAMLSPKVSSLPDGNISYDMQNNPISVNAGFLDVCNSCDVGFACGQGYSGVLGTGFESNQSFIYGIQGSAATGWLQTSAPIEAQGSEITLDFLIWDSGDGVLDSTTIIDNFKFSLDETGTGTLPVPE